VARRDDLHLKAEYIAADLSLAVASPLQSCGGPYNIGTKLMSANALAIHHLP
jgi:hypothetical protein